MLRFVPRRVLSESRDLLSRVSLSLADCSSDVQVQALAHAIRRWGLAWRVGEGLARSSAGRGAGGFRRDANIMERLMMRIAVKARCFV